MKTWLEPSSIGSCRPGGGVLDISLCGPAPYTLTLFKTKIADFPTLFKTEFRFSYPV